MINKDSLLFSITTFFILTLISVTALFSILLYVEHERSKQENTERILRAYKTTDTYIKKGLPLLFLQEQLKDHFLTLVPPNTLRKLTEDKCIEKSKKFDNTISFFKIYEEEKERYFVKIETKAKEIILFEDMGYNQIEKIPLLLIGLFLSITTLILSYIAIIGKLKPLKNLTSSIKKLGEGDLDISTHVEGNDEIATLANNFDYAIKNINKLKKSREFFLRNIMHELKTPITKGKITTALLDNSSNKDRLSRVFNRLELLINEFASIEKIIAGAKEENIKEYRLVDLVDGAKDLLFEQGEVKVCNHKLTLFVDYNLFTVALKNIIENGFKHSTQRVIQIQENNKNIEFITKGKPLQKSLSEYIKPFEKDNSDGFGLGLYIINTVLEHHKYKLEYRYEDDKNIFFFKIKP